MRKRALIITSQPNVKPNGKGFDKTKRTKAELDDVEEN